MNELVATERAVERDSAPVIERGALLCYRTFDLAEAIDLEEAARLLSAAGAARRDTLMRAPPRHDRIALRRAMPTLGVAIGTHTIELARIDRKLTGKAIIHAYERGTLTVAINLPLARGTSMAELPRLVRELFDDRSFGEMARREALAVLDRISPSVHHRHDWDQMDGYTIAFIEALAGGATAADVLAWPGTAKLLLGETATQPLHPRQVEQILAHVDGYLAGDLLVIGDRCALVVEPSGDADVPHVIEYVRAQLMELAFLDEHLDDDLEAAHHALATRRGVVARMFLNPHGDEARQIARRLAESTRVSERIEASMRLLGDSYLARVARAALTRFRAADLQASIARKHDLVSGIHEMLHADAQDARGLTLEITIVALIVIEVVFALFIE